MKHARVAFRGAIRSGVVHEHDRRIIFRDGSNANFKEVVWLPPVEPRTVFALGLNYADHATELSFNAPTQPLVFLKGPRAFVGHRGCSPCPADVQQMHSECELCVVIGRAGRQIPSDRAYEYVTGYTVANDYALRDYLENFYRPNLRVKNRDYCTPLGPWLVDAADIADPMNLQLRSWVNGKPVQNGSTRDMIFTVPKLIEYLSSLVTLSPGDLILTGTPSGVVFVKPGDEVITEIESVGRLVNTIVAETINVRDSDSADETKPIQAPISN